MTRSTYAIINPELLTWAREESYLSLDEAAEYLSITLEKIKSWESGETKPTVTQLRNIAKKYKQPFAVFYLPTAPERRRVNVKDYRRLPGGGIRKLSNSIFFELRNAYEKRDIALELYQDIQKQPMQFSAEKFIDSTPEGIASQIRNELNITDQKQHKWKDTRIAFNYIREALESLGVLVLQTRDVELSEMRGFSIYESILPVIVVNRKDSYSGRTFTLLHELTHLIFRESGICNLDEDNSLPPEESSTEIMCNKVAGLSLVTKNSILSEDIVEQNNGPIWKDGLLVELSKRYSVSKEVILRRLLDLGMTNEIFYREKRTQFIREYQELPQRDGFIPPAINIVSLSGRLYVSLVLTAVSKNRITLGDASDYLGLKFKHFNKVAEVIGSL